MPRKAYQIDAAGWYISDVILHDGEDTPKNCTETPMPQPIGNPKFENGAWVDGGGEFATDDNGVRMVPGGGPYNTTLRDQRIKRELAMQQQREEDDAILTAVRADPAIIQTLAGKGVVVTEKAVDG